MGIFDKIKKGVEHAAKEAVKETKKAGKAVGKGVEHAAKEAVEETKKAEKAVGKGVEHVAKETIDETEKAGKAVAKGIKHAAVEFHEEFIESHGSGETSPDSETTSSEKSGVIFIISGSGVGCGVTVDNLDTGKRGEHQDPGARDCNECRNVFDVAFEGAGIESVCQVASCELWISTKYKWKASHYGPSVTQKSKCK